MNRRRTADGRRRGADSSRSAPPPPRFARGKRSARGKRGARGRRGLRFACGVTTAVIARSGATKQSPCRGGDCFPHASLGTCALLAMTVWARRLLRYARNDSGLGDCFALLTMTRKFLDFLLNGVINLQRLSNCQGSFRSQSILRCLPSFSLSVIKSL